MQKHGPFWLIGPCNAEKEIFISFSYLSNQIAEDQVAVTHLELDLICSGTEIEVHVPLSWRGISRFGQGPKLGAPSLSGRDRIGQHLYL